MTEPWTGRLVRKNPHLVAILCSSQFAQPSWYIYLHVYGKCRYILDPSWVLYSIYFQIQSLNESVRSRLRETSQETPSPISLPRIAAQTPNSWKHDNIIHREPPKKFLTSGWLSPPFSKKNRLYRLHHVPQVGGNWLVLNPLLICSDHLVGKIW